MNITKTSRDSLYAFLISLLLHGGAFLVLLSASTKEALKGELFFIRLLSLSEITGEDSAVKTSVFHAQAKSGSQNHKQEAVKDKKDQNLLDELKILRPVEGPKEGEREPGVFQDHEEISPSIKGVSDEVLNAEDISQGGESPYPSTGNKEPFSAGLNESVLQEGPAFIELIKPVYPSLARRLGREGTVLLRLKIDEDGIPVQIEVIKKAGFGFDESAVNAMRHSRFRPALKNGRPVPSVVILPVRFVLEE